MPKRLLEQLLSVAETRQEEGLHILLNACVTLLEDGSLSNDEMIRLTHILSDLREEATYSNVIPDSRRAVVISLVRQQCVRLAQLLKEKVPDDGVLHGWVEEGRLDPLPEVRFSVEAA
jgi:Flp pilus assembly CpaE family ATPase